MQNSDWQSVLTDFYSLSQFAPYVLASNPATHRLEHEWQYTHIAGLLKYQMLPEDGLCKTETCWGL
jgi:hypothetical protein